MVATDAEIDRRSLQTALLFENTGYDVVQIGVFVTTNEIVRTRFGIEVPERLLVGYYHFAWHPVLLNIANIEDRFGDVEVQVLVLLLPLPSRDASGSFVLNRPIDSPSLYRPTQAIHPEITRFV